MKRVCAILTVSPVMLFLFAAGCSQASVGPTAPPAAGDQTVHPQTEPWRQQWNKVVEGAKREGQLTIFSNVGPEPRANLGRLFKDRYGISVEFLTVSRGLELTERMVRERRAGLFTADVVITGGGTIILTMKPEGLLDPIEPLLILPEVLDKAAWLGGKPFVDKEHKVTPLIADFTRHLTRNTALVRDGELKSYSDVLDPRWKGKIIMNDPTISGTGSQFFSFLKGAWGLEKAKEYMKQLVKQEPMITRDRRLQSEWVAQGKYPIGVAVATSNKRPLIEAGAPIADVMTGEGVYSNSLGGVLAVPSRRPHPNASTVFVNWLLSKEGMTIFSKSYGSPSSRRDVPITGVIGQPPFPGEPIVIEDEEDILFKDTLMDIAKEIFAPLLK